MNILIDGALFTSRAPRPLVAFWEESLPRLVAALPDHAFTLLNRGGLPSLPPAPNLVSLEAPPLDPTCLAKEDRRLAALCRELQIDVFLPTWATTAGARVHSLFLALEEAFLYPSWVRRAGGLASAHMAVSEAAAQQLAETSGIPREAIAIPGSREAVVEALAERLRRLTGALPTTPRRLAEGEAINLEAAYFDACGLSPDPFQRMITPLPLEGRRGVAYLHLPDWSSHAWEEVLQAYVKTFSADEDVSLVLWLDPDQGVSLEDAAERINGILEAIDHAGGDTPDLLLVPDRLDIEQLAQLYAAVDRVVPHGDRVQADRALKAGRRVMADLSDASWRDALAAAAR